MDVHPSALKHGVLVEDIEHAVRSAMAIDELEDDLCSISDQDAMVPCSRSSPWPGKTTTTKW